MKAVRIFLLILIIIGIVLLFTQKIWVPKLVNKILLSEGAGVLEQSMPTDQITYINASANLIVVELPFPGAVTGKEFSVIGKARGFWFFEASFPMELLDKDGKIIATGYSQAEDRKSVV